MNALFLLSLLFITLGVLYVLFIVLVQYLAKQKWQFTTLEEGNTTFVNAGESLKFVWPNIKGHKLSSQKDSDGNRWLIREPDKKERVEAFFHKATFGTMLFQKWLWRKYGIRFVSFFYPFVGVHTFKVSRKRLVGEEDLPRDAKLVQRIIPSPEQSAVSSLLFKVPRPIYMEGLELGGENAKINILLLTVFQQVIPAIPVYVFKGEFFSLLDAAVEAVVVDFLATHRVAVDKKGKLVGDTYDKEKESNDYIESPLTYSLWTQLAKGENAPLEDYLRTLNASKIYYDNLKKEDEGGKLFEFLHKLVHSEPSSKHASDKDTPHGIIPRFGFALTSTRLIGWETHETSVGLAKALLEKEVRYHTAQGVIETSKGDAAAIKNVALAEARRYSILVDALIDKGVDKNTAAGVVREQIRTENIGKSNIVTYVEGGASVPVLIPSGTQ